jgi:1-acyl-sn-glycerol-3-phosphate acyltransferase
MLRAWLAIAVWALLCVVVGIPLYLAGWVYPSRRLLAAAGRLWARMMLWISGVRLTMEGRERISNGRPHFFVGNHQSDLDIPILVLALKGDVRFLAKHTLFRIPIFGWVMRRYGFVAIDRRNARRAKEALERMLAQLRRNPISFAVFPEGTRSRNRQLLPFRKGTMKVVRRSGLPVVPFSIDGAVDVHHRDELRARPGPIRLTFGDPIPAEEVARMSPTELHDRVRRVIERQLGLEPVLPAARPAATAVASMAP